MTEENHCYENALDATFADYGQAQLACEEAIQLYNTRRPHWALGFKTPEAVYRAA
jgi:transposase InsO family protein